MRRVPKWTDILFGAMCVFCDVAAGRLAVHVVFEDDVSIAFLDHRPLFPGHSLLIPREHFDTLADLPSRLIDPYFTAVQALARAVESAFAAKGTFVAINNKVSQSVPHLHTHIVPRRPKDGLRGFFWPRTRYRDDADMAEAADRIKEAVASQRV